MLANEEYLELVREVLDAVACEHATAFENVYCFDSIVDDGQVRIAIKVSNMIDNVWPETLQELRRICHVLRCTPLIVGERTRKRPLQMGVVHTRGSVAAINLETLQRMLDDKILPYLLAKKGGIHVVIDGQKLKNAREARNLSRGDVAREIGVSRRAVYEYERGTMNPIIDIALRLEELLESPLIEPLDLLRYDADTSEIELATTKLDHRSNLAQKVLSMLSRLGLHSTITRDAPFDMLTPLHHQVILSCLHQHLEQLDEGRLRFLAKLANVLDEHSTIIASEPLNVESFKGIPIVYLKELMTIQTPTDFISLIRTRRGA